MSVNTRKMHFNDFFLLIFIILFGMVLPDECFAMSSSDDVINPYVDFNMLYDSNYLRLSDKINAKSVIGKNDKSDFIQQLSAGFDLDWHISRQHFLIKANINQNWFQNFSILEYTGWNTQSQWNWQIGNNLNGEIGYTNIQVLGNFSYLNSLEPNLQNNQRIFGNFDYLFHPNGKIKLGLFRNYTQFDDKSRQFSSNIEDNAELTLQYLSPTSSVLGLRFLATEGQYPDLQFKTGDTLDNAYTRFSYALTWDWIASSKTRIDGSFGYTEQHYANLSSRNFSGIIGGLGIHWQANDRTLLDLTAIRDIYQSQNLAANFLLIQGVEFDVTRRFSPKFNLKIHTSYQEQQFLGNFASNAVGIEREKDDVGIIGLNLNYSPLDNLSIGVILNYEKRDSNVLSRSYETQSAGINLKAAF